MITIYFIKDGSRLKIGYSKDVDRRLQELQTANAEPLSVVAYILNQDPSMEHYIHGVCERYRIHGEWFDIRALDHLKSIPYFKDMIVCCGSRNAPH